MSTPPPASLESYDAVPYSILAFADTDPDRLAVMANLFHFRPPPPHRSRVLELGCASGGNLIPLALAYPESTFVGIDLSQRQIADGNALLKQLPAENVRLLHLNITDVTPALGSFDYILAHGVYSWVPPLVQSRILDICRDNLSPTGVAYISYNALPGWHVRGAIRDLLLYHTRGGPERKDPLQRVHEARQVLEYLEPLLSASTEPFHAVLVKEMAPLKSASDTYLLHEYLEEFNEPLHFHEFVARAEKKDLQYLAEAQIAAMSPARFGPEKDRALREMSPDALSLEQAMDFLCNRTFRQSLLCHRSHRLERRLNPDALQGFYIATPMKPESNDPDVRSRNAEIFSAEGRPKLTARAPVMKAALVTCSKRCPLPIPFPELLAEIRALLGRSETTDEAELITGLMNCYMAGVVEFTASPPPFITHVTERPETSAYIRLRARQGTDVTNLRLNRIALTEPARLVLSHLDGEHDRDRLAALVTDLFQQMPPSTGGKALTETHAQRAVRYLDYILPNFAHWALLKG
jgi:methyltransferase-like protein